MAIGARALIFAAVHIFATVNKTNIFYSQSDSVCDSAILPYNFHRFPSMLMTLMLKQCLIVPMMIIKHLNHCDIEGALIENRNYLKN